MYITKIPRSRFYQLVYFVDGKRTTVSTKKETKAEAQEFLNNFQNNSNLQTAESPSPIKPANITLEQFKDEYHNYVKPTKSKKYVESIISSFSHLINYTGDIELSSINIKLLDQFFTSTYSRTERGAHHFYRTLKAAFNKAVAWEYLQENPFTKIILPRLPKVNPIFIGVEELKVIISETEEQFLKDLFNVAFYTGMRLGEITNMRWDWIDKSNQTITLKCTEEFSTKSRKERIIPINSNIKPILLTSSLSIGYIFTNSSGIKLNNNFVSKKFKKAVRSATLNERIHFHTLRHSFASLLVQKGVSLYVVKELLGHEDIVTTQIYSHLQTENLFDAVEAL